VLQAYQSYISDLDSMPLGEPAIMFAMFEKRAI